MSYGPQLVDISNHQPPRHATFVSRPKWSRVPRTSPSSKEALFSYTGQKRDFVVDSNQLVLPNKKFLVSQDDKENSKILAEAGSLPY